MKLEMIGYWDAARRARPAEDHAIAEWKSCTLKEQAAVGAARRANDAYPIGGRSDKRLSAFANATPFEQTGAASIVWQEQLTLAFLM